MAKQRSRSRVTQGKQWTAVVDCLALLCMGGGRRGDNGPAAAGGEPPEALPRETITEALMQVPGCIFQDVTGQLTGFLIKQARTGGGCRPRTRYKNLGSSLVLLAEEGLPRGAR
jgi:hypothetical protein